MKDRLPEIERDLKQHYKNISIYVLGTWKHRGNIELYFKYRYREFNYPIGKLTEYYKFDDVAPVLNELHAMQPKTLRAEELEILNESETAIALELI